MDENKIIMLGTGNGATIDLYNTCFVINNINGNFLIDTGGSIEIIRNLNKVNIDFTKIKNIFISHSHTDHIFGFVWIFKKLYSYITKGTIEENINVYCNDVVYDTIIKLIDLSIPKGISDKVYSKINFIILNDGNKHVINGVEYSFIDIQARGTKQFGFICELNNKKFAFLGDETINESLYNKIEGFDYVMHEAFCLDSEDEIFHASEKNHSTAKNASMIMNNLSVKNLILYHTEESHREKRKELYTKEAQEYFD